MSLPPAVIEDHSIAQSLFSVINFALEPSTVLLSPTSPSPTAAGSKMSSAQAASNSPSDARKALRSLASRPMSLAPNALAAAREADAAARAASASGIDPFRFVVSTIFNQT